jgi:CubicO group peptidase (beta-lactamase class C family)
MRYSGGSYVVIQQLIEDLSGQPFQDYVEKEIFQKLGLQHSTYNYYPDKNLNKPVARGHNPDGKIEAGKKYNVFPEAAAAGFWSTPSDLAKILIQIQKEEQGQSELILNQKLVAAMLTPQFDSNPRGLGVVLMGAQRAEGFGHAGNNPGYNSLLYATTATGQGAVVMVNSDEGINLAQEVIRSIANEYNWPFMRTHLVKELSKEQRKKYLGTYQTKEGFKVRVEENRNGLYAKYSNPNVAVNLYPIAAQQFVIKEEPDNIIQTFISDKNSKAMELVLNKYGGAKMVLRRIK